MRCGGTHVKLNIYTAVNIHSIMSDVECPICLARLDQTNEPTIALLCCHSFHQICMQTYCNTVGCGVAEVRCPVCKRSPADMENNDAETNLMQPEQSVPPPPLSWSVGSTDRDLADPTLAGTELENGTNAPPNSSVVLVETAPAGAAVSNGRNDKSHTCNSKSIFVIHICCSLHYMIDEFTAFFYVAASSTCNCFCTQVLLDVPFQGSMSRLCSAARAEGKQQ